MNIIEKQLIALIKKIPSLRKIVISILREVLLLYKLLGMKYPSSAISSFKKINQGISCYCLSKYQCSIDRQEVIKETRRFIFPNIRKHYKEKLPWKSNHFRVSLGIHLHNKIKLKQKTSS